MTVVRDLTGGGVVRTEIGACDLTFDQSWIAYLKLGAGSTHWLISRDNTSFSNPGAFLSLGYEGGILRFYPGSNSGHSLPGDKWLVVGGVHDGEAGENETHFYAYDLAAKELLFAATGGPCEPTHGAVAERLQFGRWGGGEQMHGLYAAAAAFGGALSEAEFLELCEAASAESWLSKSPLGLWLFDQTEGEEIEDLAGNGADGPFELQDGFATQNVSLPMKLRAAEGGGGEEPSVQVKTGGGLVTAKRYVKQGGVLVPA